MIAVLLALAMCAGQQLQTVDRDGSMSTLAIDQRVPTPIIYNDAGRVLLVRTDRGLVFADGLED